MRGCIVIQSDKQPENGLKDLFNILFSDSPVFTGNMFTDKFAVGFANEIQNDTGIFAMSDNTFYEVPVPSRGSMVVTCFDGVVANREEIDEFTGITEPKYAEHGFYPSKLVVRLNSNKHQGDSTTDDDGADNYANRVKSRVIDKMIGNFVFTVAYITLSGRSRVLIGKRNRDVYFHLVYNNGFYALVWTDEVDVFKSLDTRFFVYSMTTLYDRDVLVIHPLYMVDKWKKWRARYKSQSGHLMAVAVFEKYLERIAR